MRLLNSTVAQVDRIYGVATARERADGKVVGPITITASDVILKLIAIIHFKYTSKHLQYLESCTPREDL